MLLQRQVLRGLSHWVDAKEEHLSVSQPWPLLFNFFTIRCSPQGLPCDSDRRKGAASKYGDSF